MLDLLRAQIGPSEALVEFDTGCRLTYSELMVRVDHAAAELKPASGHRPLTFLLTTPTLDFVVLYLACLSSDQPVLLLDPISRLDDLLEVYRPARLLVPNAIMEGHLRSDGVLQETPSYSSYSQDTDALIHESLGVLLTTSGSTGSPKLVRLSLRSVRANALSIASYLELGPGERSIQSLPMHYSYGLSIINSHLVSGGAVVLTGHSFMRPEFWDVVNTERCTSFAGIPYMYETLHRLRFDLDRHPTIRTLTQAGGHLKPELAIHFHNLVKKSRGRFFVMYGQTEATARISYLPPERLEEKIGTIGIPIPGGRMYLRDVPGLANRRELVYEGSNVMMGYAESLQDLAKGDCLNGVLTTGDLAEIDSDGFFKLVGRLNRFAKLFGLRISLDDVEQIIEAEWHIPAAVLERNNELFVVIENAAPPDPNLVVAFISKRIGVPPKAILVRIIESIPKTSAGKKNYSAIKTESC